MLLTFLGAALTVLFSLISTLASIGTYNAWRHPLQRRLDTWSSRTEPDYAPAWFFGPAALVSIILTLGFGLATLVNL